MMMPGRKYEAGNGYRYGFNGKENDNEVKGEGNSLDFDERIFDPRLGRFLSVDPMADQFVSLSPYSFGANSPIKFIDEYGNGPKDPVVQRIYKNTNGDLFVVGSAYTVQLSTSTSTTLFAHPNIEVQFAPNAVFALTKEDGTRYVAAFDPSNGQFLGYENFNKPGSFIFQSQSDMIAGGYLKQLIGVEKEKFTEIKKTKNHKGDPATKYGVTLSEYNEYAEALGLKKGKEGLKKLSYEDAATIYQNGYWLNPKFNFEKLNQYNKTVTMMVFEFGVNAPRYAISAFVEALNGFEGNNFANDGKITDEMIEALKKIDATKFQYAYAQKLDEKWESLPKAKKGFSGLKTKADKYKEPKKRNRMRYWFVICMICFVACEAKRSTNVSKRLQQSLDTLPQFTKFTNLDSSLYEMKDSTDYVFQIEFFFKQDTVFFSKVYCYDIANDKLEAIRSDTAFNWKGIFLNDTLKIKVSCFQEDNQLNAFIVRRNEDEILWNFVGKNKRDNVLCYFPTKAILVRNKRVK